MISLQNINKAFIVQNQTTPVLHSVSLQIEAGVIHGITGASGAGKSTLLRLINGLEKPTNGTVSVKGQDITLLSDKQLRQTRQSIGMIFQQFNLLDNKTVRGNVMTPLEIAGMPKKEQYIRAEECLHFVGLQNKADHYPAQLSGGQKQRVAIARALANNPEILLCDEPTSSLDPQTTGEILDVLRHINEQLKVTIVIVTHQMDVIRSLCTHVSIMDNGRIIKTFATEPTHLLHTKNNAEWYLEHLLPKAGHR